MSNVKIKVASLPAKFVLAVSGGVDSVTILDFVSRNPSRLSKILHFHHGTENADLFKYHVQNLGKTYDVEVDVVHLPKCCPNRSTSNEHFWAVNRRAVYELQDYPVVLCHHFDDAKETAVMSMLRHGVFDTLKPVSGKDGQIRRPFLLTKKKSIIAHAEQQGLGWCEDPTNYDPDSGDRNYVRNTLLPLIEKKFSLDRKVKKLLVAAYNQQKEQERNQ